MNAFLGLHQTGEVEGYPTLLMVSMVALALVVTPVVVLGVTGQAWVLAVALLAIPGGLALLGCAMHAAFSDVEVRPPAAAGSRPLGKRPGA